MSEQNTAPRAEDVTALAGEMRELKEIVREVSGKLGRIEKRLRALFPNSFPTGKTERGKAAQLADNPPTITPQQALDLYTELVGLARSGGELQVEARVAEMGLGDLALLVKELGAPLGKKPSRPALVRSLMGRLKESIMLSRHTNRPAPSSSDALPTAKTEESAGTAGPSQPTDPASEGEPKPRRSESEPSEKD